MSMIVDERTIRVLLKQHNITLSDLAGRCDVHRSTLYRFLRKPPGKGRRWSVDILEGICRELQCQPGDFLKYAA